MWKLWFGALGLLWSFAAHADEALEDMLQMSFEELLDYEVVTPTRTSLKLKDTPGSVKLITREDIRRSSAQTIPELLRTVAGVNVRWNPMVQTIDIRGFGSNPFTSQILLMIDGVPYNSWNKAGFPQHPGFDFFNLANVKHIEFVRGPGSALYGENAFNGMINIVTLSGEDVQSGRVTARSGSNRNQSFGYSQGFTFGDDGSVFANVRRFRGQLPTELWYDEADSDATGVDAFVKVKKGGFEATYYRLEDEFEGFRHDPGNPGFPPGTVFRSAEKIEQTVNIFGLGYQRVAESGAWSVKANASHAERDGSHCAGCHAPAQHPDFEKSEDHGYQTYLHMQAGYHAFEGHDLLVGIEARRIASGDHSHELHGAAQLPAAQHDAVLEYDKYSFFLQDRLSLGDNLQIIAGLRFDGRTDPELFDREFHPRLAVVYSANEQLTLRASWGKAARYPSFSELYQASGFLAAESPTVTIPLASFQPNHELKRETIEAFEVGADFSLNEHWQLGVDAYQNLIEDRIALIYPLFRYENHDQDARVRGFEAEVKYSPSRALSAFANYAYQDNKRLGNGRDSVGNPLELTYASRHKINAGFTWTPNPNWSVVVDASWRDEYDAPAFWYPIAFGAGAPIAPLDGYTLVNASVRYRLPLRFGANEPPLTVGLLGRNLGNERPYETLTGFGGRMAGREAHLVLEYVLGE